MPLTRPTRDPWSFHLIEPRLLHWVDCSARGRTCECRLMPTALAPQELHRRDDFDVRCVRRIRRNMSRNGFNRNGYGRTYCSHIVGRRTVFSTVPIGCGAPVDRYTEDDRGVRWYFCEDCAPPVVGTEWCRAAINPRSMVWPFWVDVHCWNCVCHCSGCHSDEVMESWCHSDGS